MKRFVLLILFFTSISSLYAQRVNGTIIRDSGNLTVVKLWGTHYERGFAYGYLCGNKIRNMYDGYYLPRFGNYMPLAHTVVKNGTVLKIDSAYFDEARGVIAGMDSAGVSTDKLDYINLIAGNCFLDLLNMLKCKVKTGLGCSSLMSWSSATMRTDLHGHSVITRQLDWDDDPVLAANQMIAVHFPAEKDEQPWAMIGFAGQIGAPSGINRYFGTFQHMMSDFFGIPVLGNLYEPIWFSLRKALEKKDANHDGFHNAKDVHDVLAANTKGYTDGYIICTLARSTSGSCDKVAEVAEIAPVAPYLVFRNNNFPDSIPGDNLYAANYRIKRNNQFNFCTRYNNVIAAMGNGKGIGSQESWNIMRDASVSLQPSSNVQMMQYIPEEGILKLSVSKHGRPAYQNTPDTWLLSDLFTHPAGVDVEPSVLSNSLFPDPAGESIHLKFFCDKTGPCKLRIIDMKGKLMAKNESKIISPGMQKITMNVSRFTPGIYLVHLDNPEGSTSGKFVLME